MSIIGGLILSFLGFYLFYGLLTAFMPHWLAAAITFLFVVYTVIKAVKEVKRVSRAPCSELRRERELRQLEHETEKNAHRPLIRIDLF